MPESHLYFGAENINLTNAQRDALVDALRLLGRQNDDFPFRIAHKRIRPDNQAAIFEAVLDTSIIDIPAMKTRIASILGVPEGNITTTVTTQTFGNFSSTVVTWKNLGTNKARTVAYGTLNGTYAESRNECVGYLVANNAAWGDT
jgi:hypothetical protein